MNARLRLATPALLLATALPAQAFKTQAIPTAGIEISVSSKLRRLPIRMDRPDPTLRARFGAKDERSKIVIGRGATAVRYDWSASVREFGGAAPTTPAGGDERVAAVRAKAPNTFAEWVERMRAARGPGRTVMWLTNGEAVAKRPHRLPYERWEYLTGNGQIRHFTALALYRFDAREVAQSVTVPIPNDATRPTGAVARLVETQIRSGRRTDDFEAEDRARDEFADTPAKRVALDAAKANVAGLRFWDYFTTEHYIVLFGFDRQSRVSARSHAQKLATALGKMRELYEQHYPPRADMEMPYSVLRVCARYEEFQRYGSSHPGVVGWFSPVSKELVVFRGGDDVLGFAGATEAVAFHEGWHQYANVYFGFELHRWFDEGHGDFFGSHARVGNGFSYRGSRMRSAVVRRIAESGEHVPFAQIVKWSKRRFYDPKKAGDYYAQAYAMVDFLRRGAALGDAWDQRWGAILETYRRIGIETGNAGRAVEAAFAGVDFAALEDAWREWVASRHFPKLDPMRPKLPGKKDE